MPSRVAVQQMMVVALLALLGGVLVYPILLTVRGGFYADPAAQTGFTLDHVMMVFQVPSLRQGLMNSLGVAFWTTILSILIALPLAILSARYTFPLKGLWNAVILVPLILPPFVGAIGLKLILGRAGALNALLGTDIDFMGANRFWGVVIAEALHLYPIIYLNAAAALANLDPAMDEAAENLGAGPWRRLMRITMPLIRSGLFAGATIVFIWSFTELGTPLMFDFYAVTPVQIFDGLKEVTTSAEPFALTVVMLVMAVGMYVVGKFVFARETYAMQGRAARAAEVPPLSPVGATLATALFAIVTGLALVPHVGVVISSFAAEGTWYRTILPTRFTMDHYADALGHELALRSIQNSLMYSGAAVALNLVVGLCAGYLIARSRVVGRGALDALSMLPLAVPGLVMAFGYVAMSLSWPFRTGDPLGGLFDVVGADPNPVLLLVIAYAVRRLPYVVRATVSGLQQTSGDLEEAAANLGASTLTTVRRIVVPLITANLIAGALLAFSFSMLEVSDSLILAQRERFYPITKAIYTFSERLGDGYAIASAMGVWGMALLATTLAGSSILLGKKLGAMFRA
jgi:iron(III) transport system permease protein